MTTLIKPMEISELAELGLVTGYDSNQPLRRYLGALRQMMREAKIYQKEKDYDKAFVYSLKILTLSNDLLPNQHPEWETLSTSVKAHVYRDSEIVQTNLSDLREAIYERNELWSKNNINSTTTSFDSLNLASTSTSTTSNSNSNSNVGKLVPALSLRNTVQPGVMSMTSSTSISKPNVLIKPDKSKEKKRRKWFGSGKGKEKEKDFELKEEVEVIQVEKENEALESVVEDISKERNDKLSEGIVYNKPRHVKHPSWNSLDFKTNSNRPLSYQIPRQSSINTTFSSSQMYQQPSQPSQAQQNPYLYQQQLQQQQQQQQQQQLPPPILNKLQRTPSRLTISHQSQQGYSPSPTPTPSLILTPSTPSNFFSFPATTISSNSQLQSVPSTSVNPNYTNLGAPPPFPIPPSLPISTPHAIPTNIKERSLDSNTQNILKTNKLIRSSSLASLPLGLRDSRIRSTSNFIPQSNSISIGREKAGKKEKFIIEEEISFSKTEGGYPLRNLILPNELISQFVALSMSNTDKGIETCGLLMGTLSHDKFSITNLLIPKQLGTSDTCSTTHEEEQFQYQDERDLMTLGWIHTHPTQSCFMSSLDLHTHASYQVMLAEAIAIVCSPNQSPGFGIFRLTDPPGLETIINCDEKGLFHPHPELPIYTDCDYGHVQMRSKVLFKFDDLR